MVKEVSGSAVGQAGRPADVGPERTPDQLVEDTILLRMEKEKLLDAQALKDIRAKLAAGQLSSQDWKAAIKNTLERRQRHE